MRYLLLLLLCTPAFVSAATCSLAPLSCPAGQQSFYAPSDSSLCGTSGGYYCVAVTMPAVPAVVAAPTPTVAASVPVVAPATTRTGLGTSGTLVSMMQQQLTASGDYTYGSITGYWGSVTDTALKRFQCRVLSICSGTPNTTGYGAYGPQTRAALAASRTSNTPTSSDPVSSVTSTADTTTDSLQALIKSLLAEVGVLQARIAALGGASSSASPSVSNPGGVSMPTSSAGGGGGSMQTSSMIISMPPAMSSTVASTQGTASTNTGATAANGPTTSPSITESAATPAPASATCTFNNQSMVSGQSVTAYQAASVAAGQQCVSEIRACTNGVLSGSYTSSACTVAAPIDSPYVVNAIKTSVGVIPAYQTPEGLMGYVLSANTLTAYSADGGMRWQKAVTASAFSGGADIDGDGYADIIVVGASGSGCSETSWGELRSGKTGDLLQGLAALQNASFSSTSACAQRWYVGSLMAGPSTMYALLPQYYGAGWFMNTPGSTLGSFYTSELANFDSYTYAKTISQFSFPSPYTPDAMVQNGIVVGTGASSRYIAFTSGRALVYLLQTYGVGQLIADTELVSGGPRGGGRNYGLVTSLGNGKVSLISGTPADQLALDVQTGSRSHDTWGGLLRHFAIFNYVYGTVNDRFYSWAHDNGDASTYINRVAYPAHAVVTIAGASYIFFNVFDGTRWYVSVNDSNLTELTKIYDRYIWDTIYRKDGQYRFLYSTTSGYWPVTPHKTDVGYYLNAALVSDDSVAGLPSFGWAFKEKDNTTSQGGLFRALVTGSGVEVGAH